MKKNNCVILFLAVTLSINGCGTFNASTPNKLYLNRNCIIDFVSIPAGSFMRGKSEKKGITYTIRRYEVDVKNPFFIGKTEITQDQWEIIMKCNPSEQKGVSLPVTNVSWMDCVTYCKKLTKIAQDNGYLPDGYEYRLPTDTEWEYAARANMDGDSVDNLEEVAWYKENSKDMIHPVAQKKPNPWGLYDMLGNVSEWCYTWSLGSIKLSPSGHVGFYSVFRGGAWDSIICTFFEMEFELANCRRGNIGFRIVLAPIEKNEDIVDETVVGRL